MKDIVADIVIVGTGAAGLYCALHLPADKKILMISKEKLDMSDSYLAQGGICVLKSDKDFDAYFEDTLKAGHYENNKESVEVMIKSSPEVIQDLIRLGVNFEKENGKLIYTKEAAHSEARILFHEDLTGKEITGKLLKRAMRRPNIKMVEYTTMIDILHKENECEGIVVTDRVGNVLKINADYVVLACGGIGGLYDSSTNYAHLTADAVAIALKHKIDVQDVNYVQIHPTTLYSTKKGRRFLISESVRGEGAILLNGAKERFVNELLPRDILSQKIMEQMALEHSKHVWLSVVDLGSENIKKRFPNIYKKCLEEGYDITKECIPVTPAQHYFMGGVKVDIQSMTSMKRLYAAGETSCNGVHGANRLASNSLLEALVFAKRAAIHIGKNYQHILEYGAEFSLEKYEDQEGLFAEYKDLVLNEIQLKNDQRAKKE